LKEGKWLNGAIKVFGEEVPEYFGPEEALYRGGDLILERC
jgi:hypothetical protein